MILIFALLTTFVNAHAQKANKEVNHKPRKLQWREYDGKNGAVLWGIIGTGSALLSTGAYFAKEQNIKQYPTESQKPELQQTMHKVYNGVFLGGCMVTGLSVVFGTNDLIYYLQSRRKEKISLKINITPSSAGLCVNF